MTLYHLVHNTFVYEMTRDLCPPPVQVPGEMLRQIRFLYDAEVKRLNPKSVQKAIRQMQHQLMDQQSTAASRVMVRACTFT